MAAPVSIGVENSNSKVTYKIPREYSSSGTGEFRFTNGDLPGKQKGVFEFSVNGSVVARHVSDDFPSGFLTVINKGPEGANYVVKFKKQSEDLNDFFY